MTHKIPNAQINDEISQKKFQISRPVHVFFKTDKLDYLGSPKTKLFLKVFPSSFKVLAALESGIATCSVFLHSFLLQHNVVHEILKIRTLIFFPTKQFFIIYIITTNIQTNKLIFMKKFRIRRFWIRCLISRTCY